MSTAVEMAANVLPVAPAPEVKPRAESRRDQDVPTADSAPAMDSASIRTAKVTMAAEDVSTSRNEYVMDSSMEPPTIDVYA